MSINLLSPGEAALERLAICTDEVGRFFFPAVRPCFALDDFNQPCAVGSCFFMQLDGARYLVTAAHVLDEVEHSPVYVPAGDRYVLLTGLFGVTAKPDGDRSKDYYDFAFIELTDTQCTELGATFFITEDMISHNRVDKERRSYMVFGFPEEMQTTNYDIKRTFADAWRYVGFHRPSKSLNESLKLSGEHHFAIRFEARVKKFGGVERDAPDPKGASGGILVDLGNSDPSKLRPGTPCAGLLSGILIEHRREHERILAIDIQVVIKHIRRNRSISAQ